jgi:hypothetical protein
LLITRKLLNQGLLLVKLKSSLQQRSTKHTYKTKDRVTRTPLKTWGELRCSGRVSSSCSTGGTVGYAIGFFLYWFGIFCFRKLKFITFMYNYAFCTNKVILILDFRNIIDNWCVVSDGLRGAEDVLFQMDCARSFDI